MSCTDMIRVYFLIQMVGANPSGLSALIQKHAGSAPASGFASGSGGNKLGGAPAGSAPGEAGIVSLLKLLPLYDPFWEVAKMNRAYY